MKRMISITMGTDVSFESGISSSWFSSNSVAPSHARMISNHQNDSFSSLGSGSQSPTLEAIDWLTLVQQDHLAQETWGLEIHYHL